MVKSQPPPRSIIIGAQAMHRPDVPTQNTPSPATFEANNVVAGHRSADRNCWDRRLRFRRFAQRQQGLIDSVDERRHFVWWKPVLPEVTTVDLVVLRDVSIEISSRGLSPGPKPPDQPKPHCSCLSTTDATYVHANHAMTGVSLTTPLRSTIQRCESGLPRTKALRAILDKLDPPHHGQSPSRRKHPLGF
jgi:hypothetical protein